MTTLKNKIVKTRKVRRCFSCLRRFEPGAMLRNWACVIEGDFNTGYNCTTCDEIMNMDTSDDIYFDEGYVKEMLKNGQTPEQLLIQIKQTK